MEFLGTRENEIVLLRLVDVLQANHSEKKKKKKLNDGLNNLLSKASIFNIVDRIQ